MFTRDRVQAHGELTRIAGSRVSAAFPTTSDTAELRAATTGVPHAMAVVDVPRVECDRLNPPDIALLASMAYTAGYISRAHRWMGTC
jgi:hypothetical protein